MRDPANADRKTWLLLPALLIATVLVYQPAWHGGLLWDDDGHVTRPALRSLQGLWRIWTEVGATQQYYPLSHSAFWLQHQLWADGTFGYHIVNITLHGLSAFLLALILRRLAVPGAVLAAAIFALHPVYVESVAWISELKNTLSGVLYLAAALAYLRFDETRKRSSYAAALTLFVLALLSKTVAGTLPAALLVVFWWKRGALDVRRDVRPLLPFFGVAAAAGLITVWVERSFIGAHGAGFGLSPIERVLVAGRAIWFYLGKLTWPLDLTFIYPRWEIDQDVWWQYLYPLAAVVLIGLLWMLRGRSRAPLAAFLLFCGTLFPALGFVDVYPFRYSFVADHFQYLAGIPIIALLAAGAVQLVQRHGVAHQTATAVLVLLVCTPLGALTWNQSRDYASSETLYRATIARSPSSWMARNNLALLLLRDGRVEEARAQLAEALRLKPDFAEHHMNMGRLLLESGLADEAFEHFAAALRLDAQLPNAHNNLGVVLLRKGRIPEALEHFRDAVRLDPDHAEAHYNLGDALLRMDRAGEAQAHLEKALAIHPDLAEAHNTLGLHLLARGEFDAARARFAQAIERNPGFARAHANLGVALQQLNRLDESVASLEQALRLEPAYAEARHQLGVTLFRAGRAGDAVTQYREALRLNPRLANAHNDLGAALQTIGQFDEARLHFSEAVRLQPDYGDAHFNLGNALHRAGSPGQAVLHYREALEQNPDDAVAHNNLGAALLALGRTREAAAEFTQALRIQPDFAEARDNLRRVGR